MKTTHLLLLNPILIIFLLFFIFVYSLTVSVAQEPSDNLETKPMVPEALLDAIQQRNKELDKKSEQLVLREQQLHDLEEEITAMLQRNDKLRQEIQSKIKQQNDKEEELLQRLAKVYGSMEPEEASRRIEKINNPLALEILSRIKPKRVAQILTGMEPSRAARYSEQLSEVDK